MAVKKFKVPTKIKTPKKDKKNLAAAKKITAISSRQTKLEILRTLAEQTNLSKKTVASVFVELLKLIEGHLKKNGSGSFTIPGIGVKITRRLKEKTKARQMVSPLTGKEVTIAAKPARVIVKAKALKLLQEFVN